MGAPSGEPANAWSDFSFLAVGLFMIYCGIHNSVWPVINAKGEKLSNPIVNFPTISIVWGGASRLENAIRISHSKT